MLLGATICHVSTPASLDIRAIAQRIADRRTELRLEQTEVAERAGLSRAYISRLEGGTVTNPKVFDLQRVADVLDMPLVDLIRTPLAPHTARYSTECAELMAQLESEPPDRAERVIRTIRTIIDLARPTPWDFAGYLRGKVPEADIAPFVERWATAAPLDQKAQADQMIADYQEHVALEGAEMLARQRRRDRPA